MFEFMTYNLKRVFNLVGLKENEFTITGDDNTIEVTMDLKRFSKKFGDTPIFEDIRMVVSSFITQDNYYKMTYESMNYGTCKNEMTFRKL